MPLLVALHCSDDPASDARAQWGDKASPLHAELARENGWVAIRLARGTTAAQQFPQLFPCDEFPAVLAINPANGLKLHEAVGAEATGDDKRLAEALKGCREALENQNMQAAAMAALAAAASASAAQPAPAAPAASPPAAAPPPPPPPRRPDCSRSPPSGCPSLTSESDLPAARAPKPEPQADASGNHSTSAGASASASVSVSEAGVRKRTAASTPPPPPQRKRRTPGTTSTTRRRRRRRWRKIPRLPRGPRGPPARVASRCACRTVPRSPEIPPRAPPLGTSGPSSPPPRLGGALPPGRIDPWNTGRR